MWALRVTAPQRFSLRFAEPLQAAAGAQGVDGTVQPHTAEQVSPGLSGVAVQRVQGWRCACIMIPQLARAVVEDTPSMSNRADSLSEAELSLEIKAESPIMPQMSVKKAAKYYVARLTWFVVLICVQSIAFLLFKEVQVSGSYTFSVASCVTIVEFCKLVVGCGLYLKYLLHKGRPLSSWRDGVTRPLVLQYLCLATFYCINNQLAFACLIVTDPGTFSVFKSSAPYITAMMLRLLGEPMNELQWVAIILLCIGILSTQYNESAASSQMSAGAYMMLLAQVFLSALSNVWNQKVLKGSSVSRQLQNILLYTFGIPLAFLSYVFLEPSLDELSASAARSSRNATGMRIVPPQQKSFFEGYTLLAGMLIFSQAFTGIAVAAVFKYADAIVKNCETTPRTVCLAVRRRRWHHYHGSLLTRRALFDRCGSCFLDDDGNLGSRFGLPLPGSTHFPLRLWRRHSTRHDVYVHGYRRQVTETTTARGAAAGLPAHSWQATALGDC